jgi:hypothetical protein
VPMNLPPEVVEKLKAWDTAQIYNPVETEKVEDNLRNTKVRRIVPIQSHYYSNHHPHHSD